MAVTPASLRANFPEFADLATYPDAEVQFWITLAGLLLGPRWDTLIDYGTQLFVAHNLSLQYNATKAGASGRNPGEVQGPLSGGSVDKVSYQRTPALVMDPKNGHWNLSTYGLRYIQMVRMIGAGAVQIGVPTGACDNGAWPGPWQSIFPNPS